MALLGISASQASQGLSPWSIMVFPLLFSAGMSLVDTLDGHLMLGAYGWAYMKPIRKIYYNMTITLVSVVVAVVIGTIEALGLISGKLELKGPLWTSWAISTITLEPWATSSSAFLSSVGHSRCCSIASRATT
ncbi:hypothetical protein QNM99_11390 [Pseudomonas sp. PCH446]